MSSLAFKTKPCERHTCKIHYIMLMWDPTTDTPHSHSALFFFSLSDNNSTVMCCMTCVPLCFPFFYLFPFILSFAANSPLLSSNPPFSSSLYASLNTHSSLLFNPHLSPFLSHSHNPKCFLSAHSSASSPPSLQKIPTASSPGMSPTATFTLSAFASRFLHSSILPLTISVFCLIWSLMAPMICSFAGNSHQWPVPWPWHPLRHQWQPHHQCLQ